ncbi:hypothetical protein TruAng_010523 [Truncatella angustata]|nr:hypothetical protein TruAng_010523 [Truncatella angustata]
MFAVGFALREYGAFHYEFTKTNLNVYIASVCLIYMSPPLLELVNYHVLGRILYYIPHLSPIHPGRVLTTFGLLSSFVEALNAIGVSYSANSALPERYINLGHALMKASLIVQLVVIALFALLASVFFHRCHKNGVLVQKVYTPLNVLSISMGLILARTIYRTIEYFVIANVIVNYESGPENISPLLNYEWYFWVFESTLMLINSVMWNVWHPGRYLPQNKRLHLMKDGVTEIEGIEDKDERSFLVTLIDPFGLCTAQRRKIEDGSV